MPAGWLKEKKLTYSEKAHAYHKWEKQRKMEEQNEEKKYSIKEIGLFFMWLTDNYRAVDNFWIYKGEELLSWSIKFYGIAELIKKWEESKNG